MTDEFDQQLAAPNFAGGAEDYVASIAELDPFEVFFRGQQMSAVNGMPNHCHIKGDPVRVIRDRQQLVVIATAAKLPVLAVVSAYAAGAANMAVVAGDDTLEAQILGTGWTPAVGDRVALLWTGAPFPFAMKRGGPVADPPAPTPPPDYMNVTSGPDIPTPPPPVGGPQTVTLFAQQTGCYYFEGPLFTGDQARYWVYSGLRGGSNGDAIQGWWFYGSQPTKIKGATVTKIEVWMQRMAGVGPSTPLTVTLRLHNTKTRTSTMPYTFSTAKDDTIALKPGQAGWFPLPTPWGQLIANGTYQGVMSDTSVNFEDPYKALIGIDHPDAAKRNIQSGALRVTYKRS